MEVLRRAGASAWGPLLAAVLTFVAWQPFTQPDFDIWRADDGEYHLLRVYVFEAAFWSGQWLPRWTPDLFVGYGYPIFNYYAPGTYYAALVLRLLGLDVYTTVQALGVLATCLGAAGAFCLARALFGGFWPGLVAGAVYAYAPYPFITNLVVRADLAETLGLALLPWALLAAWRAAGARVGTTLALAASIGAIILTHNLTALIALPMAAVTGCFAALRTPPAPHGRRWSGLRHVAGGLALGLALTAFFWLPAMAEQRHVQIEVALGGGHKSPTAWLINPLGATFQTAQPKNPQTVSGPLDLHLSYPYDLNFPPKPSLAQGALFIASIVLIAYGALRRHRARDVALFALAGTVALWLLTTTWSAWAWDHVPLMSFLQFSWRLYGPLGLALGLTSGAAVALALGQYGVGSARRINPATELAAELAAGRDTRPRITPGMVLAAIPVLLAVLLAFNTTTARSLWISDDVERRAGGPQLVGTENTLFGAGTTTGGEFVPRSVDLQGYGERRYGNGLYERLYPEFGWLAGRVLPLEGELQVTALSGATTWTDARVWAQTPGVLAFRTVAFPGWRAYLDGAEVTPGTAPRDPQLGVAPGFITVAVPAGEHHVQIAFGPTRLRTLAAAISVLTLAFTGWWAVSTAKPTLVGGQSAAMATTANTVVSEQRRRRHRRWYLAVALSPAALFALSCTHDAVRPVLGAPVRPRPADTRLVADLLALAQSGQSHIHISSPGGAALGPYVNATRARLEGRERAWLYMHAPSSVSYELDLPERAAFQAGLGVDPEAWTAPTGDGLRFVVEVTPAGPGRGAANASGASLGAGAPVRVLDEHVNPRSFGEHRRWLDRWVDLSVFGGQRVTLTLRTEPGPTAEHDWSGWANPVIVVQRDARRPGGGPPGPVPTPRAS